MIKLRIPERLRRHAIVSLAVAAAVPTSACSAQTGAEPEEDSTTGDELNAAPGTGGTSCEEAINRVMDIRLKLLDRRQSVIWAFLNEGPDAYATVDSAPDIADPSYRALVASLTGTTYARWTPSDKVRSALLARGGQALATSYLVIRATSPTGTTRVVYLYDWGSANQIAYGQMAAGRNGQWAWTCPAVTASAPTTTAGATTAGACTTPTQGTSSSGNWNNWPNWSNWCKWQNT